MSDRANTTDEEARGRAHVIDALSRHPLAPILVSFLLTGVVGSMLTSHFSALRQREADIIAQREGRRNAALEMSRLFTERITRAEMLGAALKRGAARDVVERITQQYDDAEASWLLRRQEALLLASEVLNPDDYRRFLNTTEARLIRKRMVPIRECLERAGASAATDAAAVLHACDMDTLVKECRPCSEALLDLFFSLTTMSQVDHGARRAAEIRARAWEHVERACP